MSRSSLRQYARDNYHNAPAGSWILGLTTGILICAVIALDLLVPGLVIFAFPFVIVPLVFSGTIQHVMFKANKPVTVGSSFRSFGLYYRSDLRGSFGFVVNLLKSLLVFLALEMTISFIASSIFQYLSKDFVEAMNTFLNMIEEESLTLEDLYNVLYINDGILMKYFMIVLFPSLYAAFIFMIYNMSRFSVMIYFRMNLKRGNDRFVKYVYKETVRRQRMKMFKDYMALNFPLYILLILGLGGGTVLGYFWQGDIITMLICGFLGGALLSSFFLPFYFGNQEALFDEYANEFHKSVNIITKQLMSTIQTNIDLSIEEKENLEKRMEELKHPLEDDEDDNKKDPGGSS